MHKILLQSLQQWPELVEPARAILQGREPKDYPVDLLEKTRSAVLTALGATDSVRHRTRTAPANTPIQASVIEAWGHASDDPDSTTLASWLDHGAPLGISEPIGTTGVFPATEAKGLVPHSQVDRRALEGWSNYASAEEEAEVLDELIRTMSPGASAIE